MWIKLLAFVRALVAKYGSKLAALWPKIKNLVLPYVANAWKWLKSNPQLAKKIFAEMASATAIVGGIAVLEKYYKRSLPRDPSKFADEIFKLIETDAEFAVVLDAFISEDADAALSALAKMDPSGRAELTEEYAELLRMVQAQEGDMYRLTGDGTRGTVAGMPLRDVLSSHAIIERAEDLVFDVAAMLGARNEAQLRRIREFMTLDQDLFEAAAGLLKRKGRL